MFFFLGVRGLVCNSSTLAKKIELYGLRWPNVYGREGGGGGGWMVGWGLNPQPPPPAQSLRVLRWEGGWNLSFVRVIHVLGCLFWGMKTTAVKEFSSFILVRRPDDFRRIFKKTCAHVIERSAFIATKHGVRVWGRHNAQFAVTTVRSGAFR